MEKTGCKIICGAPTTLAVKGVMMMMMSRELFIHRVRVRVTAGSLCVTIPICLSKELFIHRVRVRVTAGSLCVTIPICHGRELFMHRVS